MKWIKNKYWKPEKDRNWIFSDGIQKLRFASDTKIQRHHLIKFDANPYLLEDNEYYKTREKETIRKKKEMEIKNAASKITNNW